jgi:hypothetical protein
LLRTSVTHHEQLLQYQEREHHLLLGLQECSGALERTMQALMAQNPPVEVPDFIASAAAKYSAIARTMPPVTGNSNDL